MTAALTPPGKQQYTDNNGNPLVGGKLYTYDTGTTVPRPTWQDAAQTILNTNPIILDARGEALVFWSGTYKVVLKTSTDVTIWTVDGVAGADAAIDELRDELLDTTDADKGSGMVGHSAIVEYPPQTVGGVLNNAVLNVKMHPWLAKGDGVTDDTAALIAAAAALPDDTALYFPAGTYIVDTGCVTFRSKTNICVYGDGAATIVRPSVQGVAPVRQDYPTVMAFDLCSGLVVRDMVIEAKGDGYGNIDAHTPASGTPRADAVINYGGSALLVCRSDHVNLENIDARLCGSCGVVYLSSCEDVTVINGFTNAKSLGYAGWAIDNYVDSVLKPKRNYTFFDPRCAKEDATYSCKAGIASEGDQVTERLINLVVIGGLFEDCATGGNALYLGSGISCFETRLTVDGLATKNCYIGVTWQKRGGATDKSWCRISGGAFDACQVSGVYVAIGTATGGADVTINGTRIDVAPASVWAGNADKSVAYSSGVTVAGFTNGDVNVIGVGIAGGEYGLWAINSVNYNVTGGSISGSIAAIWTYGGGILRATGGRLTVTTGDRVIGRNTNALDNSASFEMATYVQNNLLECANDTVNDYPVILAGTATLFTNTAITDNQAPKGQYAVARGSAVLFDVDFGTPWTPVVRGAATAGTYQLAGTTVATYARNGRVVTVNAYIVLAGVVTGGGTGELQITGLPYPKRADSAAWGTVAMSGVTYSAGKQLAAYFGTTGASSGLLFWESASGAGVTLTPIGAVVANSIIAFSITYEI